MRFFATVACMAALMPQPAAAQPAPWAPERLTPGWVFTPSLVVGALHDSNVTLRAVNEPISAEWVALLNPRGELDFNGRRTHLNLGYSGSLEAYRQFSELNRYEQRGRLELRHQAQEHLQLTAQASYARVPTTDRLELGPGVLPFLGIGSEHGEARGGFTLQTSPRVRVEGQIGFQTIRFDREAPTDPDQLFRYLRNGHSVSPAAGLMYSVSPHVSVGAAWNYRHAVVGDDQEVFNVHSTTAELAWQPLERTTLRAGVGASHLTSDANGRDPLIPGATMARWGPAYHVGLDHRQGRVEIGARYERSFAPSIGFGGLNANQQLSANAHVPFAGGRMTAGGSISYGRTEPVDLFGVDFRLNSLWTQGTVGYQVSRWLRAEAFVNRTHQTSSARGQIDRTRIGFEFVTSKPMRIQP